MNFDWDEKKSASNLKKHGVDFSEASVVFEDPFQLLFLDRYIQNEARWKTIGMANGVLLLLVVHTLEGADDEEFVRIISARQASPQERKLYEEGI